MWRLHSILVQRKFVDGPCIGRTGWRICACQHVLFGRWRCIRRAICSALLFQLIKYCHREPDLTCFCRRIDLEALKVDRLDKLAAAWSRLWTMQPSANGPLCRRTKQTCKPAEPSLLTFHPFPISISVLLGKCSHGHNLVECIKAHATARTGYQRSEGRLRRQPACDGLASCCD